MTLHYKVWLEIEEIDESRDHYQTMDTPRGSVASFTDYEDACRFVGQANKLLASLPAVESPSKLQPGATHATSH
ncbi:MAG: hypothetical protein R3C28_14450 [Pirellulaceae bacterium]